MTEPRTEAGRILLREHSSGTPHMARHILAIEAEAARAPEGLLVDLAASIPGTCDWGGCDNNALLARHDEKRGWLPVCQWHAGDASAADLAPITAVAFEDVWDRALAASPTTPKDESWRKDVPGPPDPPRRQYPEPMA